MERPEMKPSPISATVDFDKDGVQHGFLRLPYSRDDSAWGSVMIPITVARNGKGPTALLTGANHGDEYEGPVALMDLAYRIDPAKLSGRVIIVPAMNYPAFRAATRTSPIDRGNMNRSFPGRPDGTVTEKIADYFERILAPMADLVVDIHAGGKTLDFLPFACIHHLPDKALEKRCRAALRAFSAPYSVMLLEIDSVGMFDNSVEAQGRIFLSTELGGGGSSSARSNAIAKRGLSNVLIHAGILKGEVETSLSIMLDMPDGDCFTFSEHDGLFEICADLGAEVKQGDLLAKIWPVDRTGVAPVDYHAKRDGILTARHFPGLIKSGDCMLVIAVREG
ncbi:N(2)-acetyl-L-2,4-diaminobutanoate deacetylase DoeB [Taklimakanibacter lacteus]|uniref:N(2)-acetyl-L-2,4-diaminobutanoate deacetylase DoeB n=1 Tax=Taklimakanibacter lacteus TaxID=2268456 RepID=UPI003F686297